MFKWKNRFWYFELAGRRFGYEQSRVQHGSVPYLDRYILYVGGPTLRLHRFARGDDDRAPHDHPWGFWTFPMRDYWEKAYREDGSWYWNKVRAWTVNWRPATYRHIVVGRAMDAHKNRHLICHPIGGIAVTKKPFWTFVVTTNYQRSWGFWPKRGEFVPWREWPASFEQVDLLKQRSRE